jgi:prepilin-type N-terminal cleavage/methylation domain-containing protein
MKTTNRNAFTLIELLVVMAIIAILSAILFPVFSQVRTAGKQAVCLSNQHQIGLGLMMYAEDYDNVLAIGQYRTIPQLEITTHDWRQNARHYMVSGDKYGYGGIYACPATGNPMHSDYSLNWLLAPEQSMGYHSDFEGPTVSRDSIPNPSGMIYMIEHGQHATEVTAGNGLPSSRSLFPWQKNFYAGGSNATSLKFDCDSDNLEDNKFLEGCGSFPRYRGATTNVEFVDGHVKQITRGQIEGNDSSGTPNWNDYFGQFSRN